MGLVIHCADIGSVKKRNFGWARLEVAGPGACTTGSDIKTFTEGVSNDLKAGFHVALGFECPLFLPIPEDPKWLTSARPGEGDRAWSAAAGACSLAAGLTETVWVLVQVQRRTSHPPLVFASWSQFQAGEGGLFIWEAFVTKAAKAGTHCGDAELAVLGFRDALPDLEKNSAVTCEGEVHSLFGAALLRAGLVKDSSWLRRQCPVIRVQPRGNAA